MNGYFIFQLHCSDVILQLLVSVVWRSMNTADRGKAQIDLLHMNTIIFVWRCRIMTWRILKGITLQGNSSVTHMLRITVLYLKYTVMHIYYQNLNIFGFRIFATFHNVTGHVCVSFAYHIYCYAACELKLLHRMSPDGTSVLYQKEFYKRGEWQLTSVTLELVGSEQVQHIHVLPGKSENRIAIQLNMLIEPITFNSSITSTTHHLDYSVRVDSIGHFYCINGHIDNTFLRHG